MKCKRLVVERLENPSQPGILFGIVVSEDENFLYFKTTNRLHQIAKRVILEISDTNRDFVDSEVAG